MKILLKNKLLLVILTALFMTTLIFGFTFNTSQTAHAAEIDYVNQAYSDLPSGFDDANEDVIYKIHCPNVRQILGITEDENNVLENYITTISFRASMGCQIYFVEGVACNKEDISSGDYAWDKYANYYDILHYDDTNKNVYVRFKNLSSLDTDETVSGALEDFGILYSSNAYVNAPQYIYLSNIEQPVTEVTSEDVFFSSEIYAAHGARGWSDYNIYMIEMALKLNQKVSHLVDSIEVSFIEGGDAFALRQSSFTVSDGVGADGYLTFDLYVMGDISDIVEQVKLQAVINYGDSSITVESTTTSLINLWIDLVNTDFAGEYYELYLTDTNKEHITKLVESYNAGFYAEIKGSQNYFADYDKNTDIKLTSLIFKIPVENFNSASFAWHSSYYQGYIYSVYVRISSDLTLSSTAYKMAANEDGTVTVSSDIEYNDSVAQAIYDSVDYFAYNGHLYVRIKNETPVSTFIPTNATRAFSASATDTSYATMTIQANTATIIYDDYNKELLAEIEILKTQLAELQQQLDAANLLTETQREEINSLQSELDALGVDYENAQAEIAYMNEQIEVMREEYQKKIDQLIAENDTSTPTTPEETEPTETEESGLNVKQIIGICAGAVLLILLVILIIPKRRK